MATVILRKTYQALLEEMKSIEKLKRDTSEKIGEAASHGDLRENAEYQAAREEMKFVLYKKQLMQSHAPFKIITNADISSEEVGFGNIITVREEGQTKEEEYYLLGPMEFELDLYPMIVTYNSPFGQALAGKKVNDNFTLDIRGKETKFTITAIGKIPAE